MRKYAFKILLLLLLLVLTDLALGRFFDYALSKATLTDFGRDNHICNIGQEDLLIFGSSRAVHHYNTQILKDSLGMESYNCGEDGQGIILNYGRLLMEKERHLPKIVIYDIQPDYDIEQNDNTKYLKWLKPHFDRNGIAGIMKSIDERETWKSVSHLYRYNSEYILLLIALTHSNESANDMGFFPLIGEMDKTKTDERKAEYSNETGTDSLKLHYLKKFIKELRGSDLFFVVSPTWYGGNNNNKMKIVEELCQKSKIPFIDFSNNPKYIRENKYFKDGMHLNKTGANEFTKDLVLELKKQQYKTD